MLRENVHLKISMISKLILAKNLVSLSGDVVAQVVEQWHKVLRIEGPKFESA